jgi:lipopolysaccharide/colanic/teichoic acid biosynthesis glycosyltransferase
MALYQHRKMDNMKKSLEHPQGLSRWQNMLKRSFDISTSLTMILILSPVIIAAWFIAAYDTRNNGFFIQTRIGRYGKAFNVIKIRTMHDLSGHNITVTATDDPRISRTGKLLRRLKIDELPQLWNVLKGDMSLVGPRPDVPGFADRLTGEERAILSIRPGITGPATLKYRNEEEILARVDNPEDYNTEVIYPDKVTININYIKNYSFFSDLIYLFRTLFG